MQLDLVVINGENAAGGAGIDSSTAHELRAAGADVITLGDHAFQRKGVAQFLDEHSSWCIRPLNYPAGSPGKGSVTWRAPDGTPVLIINLIGRVFIGGTQGCPFRELDRELAAPEHKETMVRLCDLHAETTSEKWAMAHHADGRLSLLVGTHTHVQTSDAQILPGGTGYITDLGMTGPTRGVIGMDATVALNRFLRPLPAPYEVAEGPTAIHGVVAEINSATGKCGSIQLLQQSLAFETASPNNHRP